MNVETIIALVERVVAPVKSQVVSMVARLVLEAVDDDATIQAIKAAVLDGETLEGIPHMQPGGLLHVPVEGSEGIILSVTGERGNAVAINISHRATRPTGLKQGETALWNDSTGEGYVGGIRILCDESGSVNITPHSTAETFVDSRTRISGYLDVEDLITADGEITAKAGASSVGLTTHLIPSPFGPLGPPTPGT